MVETTRGPGRTIPGGGEPGAPLTQDENGDLIFDDAGSAPFTPTTSGDWSPAPTTVQEALDQLAERVAALE